MIPCDEVTEEGPTITQLIFKEIKGNGQPIGPRNLATRIKGFSFGPISRELDRLVASGLLILENGHYWPREIKTVQPEKITYVVTVFDHETPGHPVNTTKRAGHTNRGINTVGLNPTRRDGLQHNVSQNNTWEYRRG